jgi:uncharacterized protein
MKTFHPEHVNIIVFARENGRYAGEERLARFPRLLEETQGLGSEVYVTYAVKGEVKLDAAGQDAVWLYLEGSIVLTLECQRCLNPVEVDVSFARPFRFVATEELAAIEDEESEEDVLVLSRDFNLLELLEDELLMAMPPAPTHAVCPVPVLMQSEDAAFNASEHRPHPFAVLAGLKKDPGTES